MTEAEIRALGFEIVDAEEGVYTNKVLPGQYLFVYDQYSGVYVRIPGNRKTANENKNQIWGVTTDELVDIVPNPDHGPDIPRYKTEVVSVIEEGKLRTVIDPNHPVPESYKDFQSLEWKNAMSIYSAYMSPGLLELDWMQEGLLDSLGPFRNPALKESYREAVGQEMEEAGASAEAIEQYLANHYPEEKYYLARGAMLRCPHGSHRRRLELLKDHAVYANDSPLVHKYNCLVGDDKNIRSFGVCDSAKISGPTVLLEEVTYNHEDEPMPTGKNIRGCACQPVIMKQWREVYENTKIEDGDGAGAVPSLTTDSFLMCQYSTMGEILPVTSGQEYESVPKKAKQSQAAEKGTMEQKRLPR